MNLSRRIARNPLIVSETRPPKKRPARIVNPLFAMARRGRIASASSLREPGRNREAIARSKPSSIFEKSRGMSAGSSFPSGLKKHRTSPAASREAIRNASPRPFFS